MEGEVWMEGGKERSSPARCLPQHSAPCGGEDAQKRLRTGNRWDRTVLIFIECVVFMSRRDCRLCGGRRECGSSAAGMENEAGGQVHSESREEFIQNLTRAGRDSSRGGGEELITAVTHLPGPAGPCERPARALWCVRADLKYRATA